MMKKIFIFLTAMLAFWGTTGFEQSLASSYTITFDEETATDNGEPIGDSYKSLGIDFLADTTSLTEPGIAFHGSTIVPAGAENAIFWYPDIVTYPESIPDDYRWTDYPYPTTQYLAMYKPEGEATKPTGVAMKFDNLYTKMEFNYRRPGSNDRDAKINISFFDTTKSKTPFYNEQITAYVFARSDVDPDHDGWRNYSSNATDPFNLVVLSSDKKFAIDNLMITAETDEVPSEDDEDDDTTNGEVSNNDHSGGKSACFISTILSN